MGVGSSFLFASEGDGPDLPVLAQNYDKSSPPNAQTGLTLAAINARFNWQILQVGDARKVPRKERLPVLCILPRLGL